MLGAEFLAATGGDMAAFGSADRLAGFAGLAPAPRDSGRVSGNLRRPRRYHRGLLRAFYFSAMASLRSCPVSEKNRWLTPRKCPARLKSDGYGAGLQRVNCHSSGPRSSFRSRFGGPVGGHAESRGVGRAKLSGGHLPA